LGYYEDIRMGVYNIFKNIFNIFDKKELMNIIEKTRNLLKNSGFDDSVKKHELEQLNEIEMLMKESENQNEIKGKNNVNLHFIDPKDIQFNGKDLEGIKIVDNSIINKNSISNKIEIIANNITNKSNSKEKCKEEQKEQKVLSLGPGTNELSNKTEEEKKNDLK